MTNPTELLTSASHAALLTGQKPTKREANKPTKPTNRKPPPRYTTADGRPPSKPRGRHAVARSDTSDEDADPRATITVPVNRRLGFRVGEYAALCGISYTSVWRGIRDKKIETVVVGGVRLIPRSFAIQQGLITRNDNV